jgi:hypothetical protein
VRIYLGAVSTKSNGTGVTQPEAELLEDRQVLEAERRLGKDLVLLRVVNMAPKSNKKKQGVKKSSRGGKGGGRGRT